MDCKRAQDLMLEAAGAPGAELEEHLGGCAECARKALALRQTMALLDEWQAPEPSPYFDVRLRARVREEAARPPAGWWAWLRKPAAGLATAALVVAALGLFNVPGADLDPLQTGTAQVAQAQRIATWMKLRPRPWSTCRPWSVTTNCSPTSTCWTTCLTTIGESFDPSGFHPAGASAGRACAGARRPAGARPR
jgi:predicted anti-sigma-YlaC factor YlaD